MSRSKVKGQGHQGQKRHFSALSAAIMWFMFGETSLASSFSSFLWSPYGIGQTIIMVALCNRADHYIFILFLLLFSRLISTNVDAIKDITDDNFSFRKTAHWCTVRATQSNCCIALD